MASNSSAHGSSRRFSGLPALRRWWDFVFPETPRAYRRTAVDSGVRAALAIGLPILAGQAAGHLALGVLVGIGAHFVLLADVGGAYGQKAAAMVGSLASMTLMVLAAGPLHRHPWSAVAGTALVVAAAGVAAAFGPVASMVGFIGGLTFVVDVGAARGLPPLTEAGAWFAGGTWSLLLSLGLWQLRPNQPLREELAAGYAAAARILQEFPARLAPRAAAGPDDGGGGDGGEDRDDGGAAAVDRALGRLGDQLAGARTVWEATRPKTRALSDREGRLLLLVENVEALNAELVATAGLLGHARELRALPESARETFAGRFRDAADAAARLGDALGRRRRLEGGVGGADPLTRFRVDDQAPTTAGDGTDAAAAAPAARALEGLCARLGQTLADGFGLAAGTTNEPFDRARPGSLADARADGAFWADLRGRFDPRAAAFRHAVRWAAATAAAQAVAFALPRSNAYWIAMTTFIILRPDFGTTVARAIARMVGTFLGVAATLALVLVVHQVFWTLAVVVGLSFLTYYVRNKSYAAFTAVVTPLMLLLLNLTRPGSSGVIIDRLLDTAVGGALAWLAVRFFLPVWERARVLPTVGQAVRATALFLSLVTDPEAGATAYSARIHAARRGAVLQNANAVAAVQRALGEPAGVVGPAAGSGREVGEADQAAAEYLRLLFQAAVAFRAHLRASAARPAALAAVQGLRGRVLRELDRVADWFEGRAPAWPEAPLGPAREVAALDDAPVPPAERAALRTHLRRMLELTRLLRERTRRGAGPVRVRAARAAPESQETAALPARP